MQQNLKQKASIVMLLDHIMQQGGLITLQPAYYTESWQLSVIHQVKAVYFDEEFDIDQDDPDSLKWNAYVDRIHKAISVENYCVWVRNQGTIVGILAFYDVHGAEIKMKHFEQWNKLLKIVLTTT